jgi:hypothetical protein
MALQIEMQVEKGTLLYQEDTYCSVTLQNDGPQPVDILVPPLDVSMPIVRVLDVRTGAEETYRRKPPPRTMPHEPGQLLPGDSVKSGFTLFDVVPCLPPGDYDIRAAWEFNGGSGMAESLPARLKVLPTTPKSISMANAFGGFGKLKYAVWVNLAGDPDEPGKIVRNRFSFEAGGGVSHVLEVADCGRTCRPVVSSPAVGTVVGSQWVAWVDGTVLHYIHVDDDLGVAGLQSGGLPDEGFDIVYPLYSDPVGDSKTRPDGGMLLCQGSGDGTQFGLQALRLIADRVNPLGAVTLAGPKPQWIMSHVRSTGQRLVTYVQSEGPELILSLAPWPGIQSETQRSMRMANWSGEFIAAGASVDTGDRIWGGTLMWKLAGEGPRQLTLLTWSVSGPNEFVEGGQYLIDWHPNELVRDARVAVNDVGGVVVLIADGQGKWQVIDGQGNLQPVPIQFETSKQPIELAFMNGSGDPLLICGIVSAGFSIVQLDGSPLPPRELD